MLQTARSLHVVCRTPPDQLRGRREPRLQRADLVSCIDEMDSSTDSIGIDVPESVLG